MAATVMNVRAVIRAGGLVVAMAGLTGCSFEVTDPGPVGPESASVATGVEIYYGPGDMMIPYVPELIPPSSEQAVVNLADGTLPEDVAAEYGLEIAEVVTTPDGGTLVLYDVPIDFDLEDLRDETGVEAADTNVETNWAEIQTLVIGFFEGEWSDQTVQDQSAFEGLDLPTAHRAATGKGTLIAVLDTGADFSHPHLDGHVVALQEGTGLGSHEDPNGLDDDEDGLIDEAYGHGTHVAGTIVTVAPGARILPIRVLNSDGIGSLWDVVHGMQIAREVGADVINLSLTLSEPTEAMDQVLDLCDQDGIAVTAAAGNYGNNDPRYPATSPSAVGIAAVDVRDKLTSFSGAGVEISLAAPGVDVLSSYPGGELWYATGTSMSTPIASGSIALVIDALDADAIDAVRLLQEASVPVTPRYSVEAGRVSPTGVISGAPGIFESDVRETWIDPGDRH